MEMNLIQLEEQDRFYLVTEVADDEGWKNIRNYLADTVGMGRLPKIVVDDVIKLIMFFVLNIFMTEEN